jgi:plastocyanin
MRPLALVLPIALLSLATGCGNSSTPASGPSTSPPAASQSSSAPAGGSSSAAGAVLTGVVGEGDAFKITLTDSTGAPVTSLKAGSYQVKVKDASKIHNFHLEGPGVEQKTAVPEVADVTWTVTLQPGSYEFKCDPHAKMKGTFSVT